MMQELVTLCMSDIGRLLGMLGLLSLGITLTLWGLKRRRSGAVVIALFLCLAALVPTVLAVEIPPAASVAEIQTSGPDTPLWVGDWYTSRNPDAGGPGYHSFEIYVPCTVPPAQTITVELYDPESNYTTIGGAPYPDLDEIRPSPGIPVPDNTTFTLTNPSGVVVTAVTYLPGGGTSQTWATFTTFTPGANGCGIYTLRVTTSDDDDNAWRLRVTPDDPDGTPSTGDEINIGNLQTSYQNASFGCQTFHFFVPDTPSVLLNNFDMDVPGFCDPLVCTVVYTTPSGTPIAGTASGSTVWNNGGGAGYPPPGGDEILDPESGWWEATLCLNDDNQYIFDASGDVYFYDEPSTPDMSVSKDDGTTTFDPGGVLTYTIIYTNAGEGAALEAVLTDTLPLSTTFLSCSGGESCGYIPPPPGSGIVTFSLGTVLAGDSGFVTVSVEVDPDVVPPATITNTVELDYTDIVFSDYPVETDTDVDQYEANPAIEIAKTVYLGHDSGASCPGGESVTGANGADVTYCFEVTNTGNTYLDSIVITDTLLGINQDDMILLSGFTPLAPGDSLVYYYETVINGDLVNTASTSGNPTDADGNDLPDLDDPTDDDTAAVDEENAAIEIAKTVYLGHDSGASCPGGESVTGANGADVTYCFRVTNTGTTYLDSITINDPDLGITEADMTLLSGFTPLAPGESLVYYYETVINGDLVNTASTSGNPTDADGNDLPDLDDPTDDDTAAVDEENAAIEIAKTVYLGHDSGASCPGGESVTGANGADVTYCFRVTNTGTTYLDSITINDPDLGITEADMTLLSGLTPLAPGESLVYYYETVINGDLDNTASTSGNPTDADGNDLPELDDPTDDDTAAVEILTPTPTPEPSEPEPSEPEPSTPTPTPTPTPTSPAPVTPTPTEVLTVERLPETGGFPGWFTVVLGVPLIIGAAGLLNLALLGMRGRRGGGKGD